MRLSALPIFAALLLPLPLAAQEPVAPEATEQVQQVALSLEQQMLLRCSVSLALASASQDAGEPWAAGYPPLRDAGREFFVSAMSQLGRDLGLSMEGIAALADTEMRALMADRALMERVMPVCVRLLPPEQQG